ncbi:bifunctional riboflavin kinase/FAD synthetase [Coxiella endosymbiont of Amblyomma sculptum]|uniref:bifunctional riboflavin kinase/FAD synthetase n=1 Tax=Coxiella endosymbiont of Amblyomma sculptum TaxID=2487929 RepID=UPI001FE9EFCA|nr:bifunctional riboflavin kinase/FAD synthetase [Coxiella endosymbiont of Amblyomma sculptum]
MIRLICGRYPLKKDLDNSCVATLGNFDGMHLGHQSLLKSLGSLGQEFGLPTTVIVFEPQPKEFFSKNHQVCSRLMRFREKYAVLQSWKIDFLLCLRFDQVLANLPPENFVKEILVDRLKVRAIVVGDDYRFGAKRVGNYQLLQKMGERYSFKTVEMTSVLHKNQRISSTRIRRALEMGNLDLAQSLLGRPYWICGKVISGEKRGRSLGFPTANIDLHRNKVPLTGIFVIRAYLENEAFQGVASLGMRPTFGGTRILLETYLFNLSCNIYGHYLRVEFLHRLRPEECFSSTDALVKQIRQDVSEAKYFFNINFDFDRTNKSLCCIDSRDSLKENVG